MKRRRFAELAGGALLAGALGIAPAYADDPGALIDWSGRWNGSTVGVGGSIRTTPRQATSADGDVRWRRATMVVCTDNQGTDVPLHDPDFVCEDGPTFPAPHTCPAGQHPLDALYRQERDPTRPGGWSTWQHVTDPTCVSDPDLTSALATDLKNLPLTPSPASIPPHGWVMVNMDTVVYTTPDPQTLQTTVLGVPVTITARPIQFTWNFADGSAPLTTTDPGQPFPHQTVAYQYPRAGTYTITLTTTWVADYLVTGTNTWEPVPGTATTTTTTDPLTVHTARTHLVAEPLH